MSEVLVPERMVHGGRALARLPGGRLALLRGALPGERVRARLEERRGVLQGEVEEVLEPSPDRVPPPLHPGLDLGFVRYGRQLELKREIVEDALRRALRREVEVPAVRPSPREWGYRSAVQPVVARGGLGYRRPGGREVVVLEEDPSANEALRAAWDVLRAEPPPKGVKEVALRGTDDGEALAALVAVPSPRALIDYAHALVRAGLTGVAHAAYDPRGRFRSGHERLAGARTALQRYGDVTVTVTATTFAQPNPGAAGELYRALAAWAPGGRHAADLYAGSGVIGFHLAPRYERVTALEIDRGAVTRGARDAARLGLDRVAFVRTDAKRAELPDDVDLVAVDPPRAGLGREVRALLDGSAAAALLYVACDVATWARDVADLEARGWRLERFEPFDFQPHTHHVELLSLLTR